MHIIRTIVWIAITVVLVAFVAMNFNPAPVNFWPLANGNYLHLNWPVGLIAILFFLLGLLPTWLLARMALWRANRRLSVLENTRRTLAPTPIHSEQGFAEPTAPAEYRDN